VNNTMLKNLILFRVDPSQMGDSYELEADLQANPFVPTGPTQQLAFGWVPPRGAEHGEMLVRSGRRHWLVKLAIEQRSVPGKTVEKRVDELAKLIEEQTGRKPGKKQRKELKEKALIELLPRAFPRRTDVLAWIDTDSGILAVDAGSAARANLVAEGLTHCASLKTSYLQTATAPAQAMANWLVHGEADEGFAIDNECELKGSEGASPAVRYQNHELDPEVMAAHIGEGKLPTKLALTYNGRVSFVLTDQAQLKKIKILDGALVGSVQEGADAFDGSLALATGELSLLIGSLVGALGGLATTEAA